MQDKGSCPWERSLCVPKVRLAVLALVLGSSVREHVDAVVSLCLALWTAWEIAVYHCSISIPFRNPPSWRVSREFALMSLEIC